MESSFKLKVSDLDLAFLEAIKRLFQKDKEITITVSSSKKSILEVSETKEEYFQRLNKALNDLEAGKLYLCPGCP